MNRSLLLAIFVGITASTAISAETRESKAVSARETAQSTDTSASIVVPDKVIALTFDDASASHANYVAPLLKKYGFGATFFVCEFPPDFDDKTKYMSWEQIAELHRLGFEIGSHTRSHKHVDKMRPGELDVELGYIERKCEELGIPRPTAFAYPAYVSTPEAVRTLADRGYSLARIGGGRTFNPASDNSRLIPSFSTTGADEKASERVVAALGEAKNGRIVVLTIHGVPDTAHPAVTTSPELFEKYLRFLRDEKYTVVALRDLAKYLPKTTERRAPKAPADR
jgi:peptidoglycan/xylan/chitin deacetylase (PgdA/CDA1 family)